MQFGEDRSLRLSDGPGQRDYWGERYNSLAHNPIMTNDIYQNFIAKVENLPDKGYTDPLSPLRKAEFGKLSPAAERLADRDALTLTVFTGDKMVARVQASLVIAGYKLEDDKRFGITGVASPDTVQALIDLQNAAGLAPTGTPDQETMKILDWVVQKGVTKSEIEALGKQAAQECDPMRQKPQEVRLFEQLSPEEQQRITSRNDLVKQEWNGQRNIYIARAQASLKLAGYDVGKHGIDGRDGPDTSRATLYFQKDRGLNPTGILDIETMIALNNATAEGWHRPEPKINPEPELPKSKIHKSNTGPTIAKEHLPKYTVSYELLEIIERKKAFNIPKDSVMFNQVKDSQNRLKAIGFDIGKCGADGKLGHDTRLAVAAFQQTFGLPVTGKLDKRTIEKIESEYAKGAVVREILSKNLSNHPTKQANYLSNIGDKSEDGFSYHWAGKNITPEFKTKVLEISRKLEMDPDILMAIMNFESGFSPSIQNPKTKATGLIQFMEGTAKGLGTTTEALAKMSAIEQLDYVYKYYKPFKGKIHNVGDAYMVTFMQIAVGKDDDFILGIKDSKKLICKDLTYGSVYYANPYLDINKDGVITKREAYSFIERIINEKQKQYSK